MTGSALGVVAHAIHYALLFGGLACVIALLLASRPSRSQSRSQRAPVTQHEARMLALRTAADSGRLGQPLEVPDVPTPDPATAPVNHSPKFFLDEGALDIGTQAMLQAALDFLGATP